MYSDNPQYTDQGLAVIRDAYPALYRHMVASPWRIQMLDPAKDTLPQEFLMDQIRAGQGFDDVIEDLGVSAGITMTGTERTYLNVPLIAEVAEGEKITLAQAWATVMVHEYAHTGMGGSENEHGAYEFQRAFNTRAGITLEVAGKENERLQIARYGN